LPPSLSNIFYFSFSSPGTYAPATGSDSCTKCDSFVYSSSGATSCDLAVEGYYFPAKSYPQGSIAKCPPNAKCAGGLEQPKPNRDHWVERRSPKYAHKIEHCPRKTCKGGADRDMVNGTSCWSVYFYNESWMRQYVGSGSGGGGDKELNSVCESDELQCLKGATGPLCGACLNGYIFSSSESQCVTCEEAWMGGVIVFCVALVLIITIIIIFKNKRDFMAVFGRWWIVGIISNLDDGALRVLWGSYQIIESVSWSLDVVFPYPYSRLVSILSVFSFDFVPIDCILGNRSNHFAYVYIWSTGPFVIIVIILASYLFQKSKLYAQRRLQINNNNDNKANSNFDSNSNSNDSNIKKKKNHHNAAREQIDEDIFNRRKVKLLRIHSYIALLFSFVILPPVSRVQFQALDCVTVAHRQYLRVDTSVSCQSANYKAFRIVDLILIVIYLSMPLFWVTILYQLRHHIDPKSIAAMNNKATRDSSINNQVENDNALQPYRFLFHVYKTQYYYFEAIEM
jgi:hypothetical protein